MFLTRRFALSAIFLFCPLVSGFESDEHQEISDLALAIAMDFHCPLSQPLGDKCSRIRSAASALYAGRDDILSYGTINEAVDFMHYPEQIFDANVYSLSSESLNPHVKVLLEGKLDNFVLFDYLSASSHNERHFQGDLMKSMAALHRSAIHNARDGYIFRALVFSALSDHFLNDFFAPGHITTQRENSHDMVALAMHDRANKAGTCFRVNPDHWGELEIYLGFIKDSGRAFLAADIDDEVLANDNLARCGNPAAFDLRGMSRRELERAIADNLADYHDQVFLKGDGRLHRNPRQKLLMLLVQVRSIAEVLGAFIDCQATPGCADPEQSATRFMWSDSYTKGRIIPPHAQIRYGEYEIGKDPETEPVFPLRERPRYASPAIADNGFLLSFGGHTSTDEAARYEAQFELFPMRIGTTFANWRDKMVHRPSGDCAVRGKQLCNVGLGYGLTHFRGDNFDASGVQLRVIKAFPKISGHLSAYLRRGKYDADTLDAWKTSYGLRYDHGFSLHSFYIGLQRDYRFAGSGFERENLVTFGWSLTFPSSRLLNYLGGYK